MEFSNGDVIYRKAIKKEARRILSGNLFTIWKPLLFIFVILFIYSFMSFLFIGKDIMFKLVANVFVNVAVMPMVVGFVLYVIKFVRGEKVNLLYLTEFYDSRILTIFALSFLIGLFTMLWSVLFIIPGIIAVISYSMSVYIFADGTFLDNPLQVINESSRLMRGYKFDYFMFGLSFFWWIILGVVTLGIAYVYVIPYILVSETIYYNELKKIKEN